MAKFMHISDEVMTIARTGKALCMLWEWHHRSEILSFTCQIWSLFITWLVSMQERAHLHQESPSSMASFVGNPSVYTIYGVYLSHPVLGWLYVFSLFPPRPRPPPQKLFPLTSKPFELNLWYLAQRIYGSGELYWMTFPWPWPKVTAVASFSQNVLVCTIKWEPLIGSLQNVAALLP